MGHFAQQPGSPQSSAPRLPLSKAEFESCSLWVGESMSHWVQAAPQDPPLGPLLLTEQPLRTQ